jgi:hypothetical protein
VNAVETHAILFLSDGKTWSEINGTSICIVTRKDMIDLSEGILQPHDIDPLFEIGLKDYTTYAKSPNR